uniref:Uncharacterized protein n=1 Tax=Rhizophora mucronata TaxID=61149 RepID=A0A2P2MKU5_RHIMU
MWNKFSSICSEIIETGSFSIRCRRVDTAMCLRVGCFQ